jgi:hypothetical protein
VPKQGEFFLSGAEPEVYKAFDDMGSHYYIMREVEGPRKEIEVEGHTYRLVE